nr:MAG TPA: hypothetical protein [Inoviridae sp.]
MYFVFCCCRAGATREVCLLRVSLRFLFSVDASFWAESI